MRRHPWLAVSVLALLGVLMLGSFPVRAYLDQVRQREELARRVDTLAQANAHLVAQAEQLARDETIERLARERYHLVRPGEEAYAILPDGEMPAAAPAASARLPGGPAPGPHETADGGSTSWWSRAWAAIASLL